MEGEGRSEEKGREGRLGGERERGERENKEFYTKVQGRGDYDRHGASFMRTRLLCDEKEEFVCCVVLCCVSSPEERKKASKETRMMV